MKDLLTDINRLRKERKAVILAHTYQPAEIQEMADFVGDSYGLSVKASQLEDADIIVFCGVSFMAETAAILNPKKTVLMPEPSAGCPMADTITAEQLRGFKAAHPGAAVVCYVNSTAAVKAESDICCRSSNALKVVKSLGDVPEILFVPDQYLGRFVEKQLGRKLICWNGGCPIHHQLTADVVQDMKAKYPDYKLMVHPETTPEVQAEADYILATGPMIDLVRTSDEQRYLVGTEEGILHALKGAAPQKDYVHVSPLLVCEDMKKTTLEKVKRSLETLETVVTVPEDIAAKARKSIEAMLKL